MKTNFLSRYLFLDFFIIIFFLGWLVQSQLLLNVDVSWLAEASRRLLAGGTYTQDFFENNPPWILYFYIPPVLLGKMFSIGIVVAMRVYIFLLTAVSLRLSYVLLQKIFSPQDASMAKFLTVMLAIIFLFLPMSDFGQREHLLFMLSMPYWLMMVLRLQGQVINRYFAISIGLLAGSVFIMKPYFLMALLLVEIYYLLSKKNILAWVRPELIAIIFLSLFYLLLILVRHADYLKIVAPYALRWCYFGTRSPWAIVINNLLVMQCFMVVLFFIATYEMNHYQQITKVMVLAMMGFFFSYLIQQEDWFYHLLPAFSAAIFLYALFLCVYARAPSIKKYMKILLVFFALLMLIALYHAIYILIYYFIRYPLAFFVFVGAILSLSLIYPGDAKDKKNCAFIALLGALIFLLPYYQVLISYTVCKKKAAAYAQLIAYVQQHAAGRSVYFFTTNIADAFPIIIYSQGVTSAARFSFFWALPGLVKQSYLPMGKDRKKQQVEDKKFLIDKVAEDLDIHKPVLVFVDVLNHKHNLALVSAITKVTHLAFDYLQYFKENKNFLRAWRPYHYLTTLSGYTSNFINPLTCQVKLNYQKAPVDKEIKLRTLYLFMRDEKTLEVILKNSYGEVQHFSMRLDKQGLDESTIVAIKKTFSVPSAQLGVKSKLVIFKWLSKQQMVNPLYKFDVYER